MIFGWFSGRNVRRLRSPRHCLRRCGEKWHVSRLPPGGSSRRSRVKEPAVPECYYILCIKTHACALLTEHFRNFSALQNVSLGLRRLLPSRQAVPPSSRRKAKNTGQKNRGISSLHHWGRGTAPAVEGVRLLLLAKRKRRVAVKNRTEGIKISYCDRDCLTYVLRIKCVDYLCI